MELVLSHCKVTSSYGLIPYSMSTYGNIQILEIHPRGGVLTVLSDGAYSGVRSVSQTFSPASELLVVNKDK